MSDCTSFLQAVLPRMGFRWRGFTNVRGQVCKRLAARVRELGLAGLDDYQTYLSVHPDEWGVLDSLCRVTISRFGRDREVFDYLRDEVLPRLAGRAIEEGRSEIACASLGCASGEEVYSLRALWLVLGASFPQVELSVLGLDADETVLQRAERGHYEAGSFRELRAEVFARCCEAAEDGFRVTGEVRRGVRFMRADLRSWCCEERFDLVLCRNLAFTYFDEPTQRQIATLLAKHTGPGGYLVLGRREVLPEGCLGWERVSASLPVYRLVM